jgi:hypothetical protein
MHSPILWQFGPYFGNVHLLLQFMQEPTFRKQVDRIYDLDLIDFEELDHDFLPLFHSVMALGYLFSQKMHQNYGLQGSPRSCVSKSELQALICLALFLMSTSRLATAQNLIALAVSASMRMGLHSQTSCSGLTPLSREIRIRVFWASVPNRSDYL